MNAVHFRDFLKLFELFSELNGLPCGVEGLITHQNALRLTTLCSVAAP